jgi:phospholipid/cholesterol/gamma-HCH transport system substrate-binding protein
MSQSFKFRFVREIAGLFVLATLALLIAAILYAGSAQGWFDEERTLRLLLPNDVSTGVVKGSEIYVFDNLVGAVTRIHIGDDEQMEAEIRLRGDFVRFVRADSEVTIHRKLGVTGDAYINISRGTGDPVPDGGGLRASVDQGLNAMLVSTVREITISAKFTFYQVNNLLRAYTELAENLEDPVLELYAVLHNVRDITEGLQQGEGTTGLLLKDPEFAAEIRQTLAALRRSVESLEMVIGDVKEATAKFPDVVGAIPPTLDQLRSTTEEVEKLIEGLQRHWLVRRYVDDEGVERFRLGPAEIGFDGGGDR